MDSHQRVQLICLISELQPPLSLLGEVSTIMPILIIADNWIIGTIHFSVKTFLSIWSPRVYKDSKSYWRFLASASHLTRPPRILLAPLFQPPPIFRLPPSQGNMLELIPSSRHQSKFDYILLEQKKDGWEQQGNILLCPSKYQVTK